MGWPIYAAYGLWLLGNWAYHQRDAAPPRPKVPDELKTPTTEDGTPVPLVYGRCLSRQPILAWVGNRSLSARPAAPLGFYTYNFDMLFIAGVPFRNGITKLHGLYLGGVRLKGNFSGAPNGIPESGAPPNFGDPVGFTVMNAETDDETLADDFFFAGVEFGDGNTAQDFSSSTGAARMVAGGEDATLISGQFGLATVFLLFGGTNQASFPPLAIELSSYPSGIWNYPTKINEDANPITVIEDLLTGGLGKLEIPTTAIDPVTFKTAGQTMFNEGHGYSRCIDELASAYDVIKEILEQIDAVLYEDPRDGLIKIKLIRPDYDLNATLSIHPGNCDAVENYATSGQTDNINAVNIQFTDRANGYAVSSARAADNAAITASGRTPNEITLRYPGCCRSVDAGYYAARELAARSQPLARCSVIVDRSFKDVMPGDVVRLSWPEYHLNEKVFRVGQVDRGTFTDGRIRLDLVQDFFFVHRRQVQPGGPVTPFPTPDLPVLA